MRERQRVASERRNPHGVQLSASRNLSAGDCMERNQHLTPPCVQPPTTTQPPAVAGHPAADTLTTPLYQQQYKNPLHNLPLSAIMKQETAKANKGRPRRAATLLGPMQEIGPPTQQETCAASILSNNHGLFKREKWECVFSFRRCRDKLQTLRRFCCLGGPEQSPRGTGRTHPQGPDR